MFATGRERGVEATRETLTFSHTVPIREAASAPLRSLHGFRIRVYKAGMLCYSSPSLHYLTVLLTGWGTVCPGCSLSRCRFFFKYSHNSNVI